MITTVDFSGLKFLPGCSAGLDEKTVLLDITWKGQWEPGVDWGARWSSHFLNLRPGEPLWGFSAARFPADFLVSESLVGTPAFPVWLVGLSIALQRWARQPVWQGAVLAASDKQARLALPYERQDVVKAALQHAARLLMLWAQSDGPSAQTTQASAALEAWLQKVQPQGWAPNTLRFFAAARQRGIPTAQRAGMLQLGQGGHAELLDSSFTGRTSALATRIAKSKQLTSQLLGRAGLPVPAQWVVASLQSAEQAAHKLGWPVVVKPSNQDQGLGVVPGIRDLATLGHAFAAAQKYSPGQVIVEKHIEGDDHRLLVVGGVLRMATQRVPGGVTGDGLRSVQALLDALNADPLRGSDERSLLIRIALDAQALDCLAEQTLTPACVPAPGRWVRLRRTANISTGGTAHDVTDRVHPDNRALAERAACTVGLDIAGIDFLCPDIARSWREVGGAVCEVNAQPGFRVHWLGAPERDINGEVLDWLYRHQPARIPTAAITGTNGKTTVARMLHHIWRVAGKTAGVCTTQGVWVGDTLVSSENLSGFPGGRMLLDDPAVQAAVIEMPRKGLLVFGHPCDRYDVAALLNVQADHIGVDGIETLDQMAELKAQVLARARHAVVVNADDPRCLAMRARAAPGVRHILVARDGHNPALQAHREAGGEGLFVQRLQSQDWVVHAEGAAQTPLMRLADMPATLNGLLRFNESNALFAMALAGAQGLPWATVCEAMAGFASTPEANPGRYNLINGFPFQVLLDFGHNPDGVAEMCRIAAQLPVTGQRRLMAAEVGSRHRAHWPAVAPAVAQVFDTVVLSCYPAYVAKSLDYAGEDPVANMLNGAQGALLAAGLPAAVVSTQRERQTALEAALARSQPGNLLVLLMDPHEALPALERARQAFAQDTP